MTDFTFADYQQRKHQYQMDGEQLLIEKKHAFLFYEPGKGKTYPCIAALLEVAPYGKVLILSTADAIHNMWEVDIVPQNILPKNTVLMTFNTAIQEDTKKQLLKIKWDVVIVDESHKIKSNTSKTSKLVYQLTKRAEYAWGLTGTPRGNVDVDVFCQFHNMNVADWGEVSYSKFVDTCCDIEQRHGMYGMYTNVLGINHRYLAGWERNIAMYSQRVCYDKDEMPPLNIKTIQIQGEITKEYKDAEKGILQISDNATTMNKLAAIGKMHQAANGFIYWTDEQDIRHTERVFIKPNQKLKYLHDYFMTHLEPITIVYRHEADLEDLQITFPEATEDINDFKSGKSSVLLLQCSRCESFNLQMCKTMFFYTLDYSYIKFKQMLHRVWRQGQEYATNIYVLLYKDTIEQQIWNTVNNKKSLADLFMSAKGQA